MRGVSKIALQCMLPLILLSSPLHAFTNNPPTTEIPSIFAMMAEITTQPITQSAITTPQPQQPTVTSATNQMPQHVLLAFEILKNFAAQTRQRSQSTAPTQSSIVLSGNQANQQVASPGSVNDVTTSPTVNRATPGPANSTNQIIPAKFASLSDFISQIGEGGEGGGLADMMATFNMFQRRNPGMNTNGMNGMNGMGMNGMNMNPMPQRPGPDVEAPEQAMEGQSMVRSDNTVQTLPTHQNCPKAEPAPSNGNVQQQTGLVLPVDGPSRGFGPSSVLNAPSQPWDSNNAQQWSSNNNAMLNSNIPPVQQQQQYPNQMTNGQPGFQQPPSNNPNFGGISLSNVMPFQGSQNPEIDLRNLQNTNVIGNGNQPFSQNQIYNLQNLANQPESQKQSSQSSMLMPGPKPDPNLNIFQPLFGGNNPSANRPPVQQQQPNQLQRQQHLQQQQQRQDTPQIFQNPEINRGGSSGPANIKDLSQVTTGGKSDVPTYYQTADGKLVRVIPYNAKSEQTKVQPTAINPKEGSPSPTQQENVSNQGTQNRNQVRYVRLPQNNIRMNSFQPRQVRPQSFQRNSQQNQLYPGSQMYPFSQRFMPRQLQRQQFQQQRRLSPLPQGQAQGIGQRQGQGQGQGETQESAPSPRQQQFYLPRFGMMSPFQSKGDSPIIEKINDSSKNPNVAIQKGPIVSAPVQQISSINQIVTPQVANANSQKEVTSQNGQTSPQQTAPLRQTTFINQIGAARRDSSNASPRLQTMSTGGQQLRRFRNNSPQILMFQNRFRPFQGQTRQS